MLSLLFLLQIGIMAEANEPQVNECFLRFRQRSQPTSNQSATPSKIILGPGEEQISPKRVTTTDGTHEFAQEEIPLNRFPEAFQLKFIQLFELAGDGYLDSFNEAGFFAVVFKDGKYILGNRITSHSPNVIQGSDILAGLEELLVSVKSSNILRVQFFRTHPIEPMARSISRQDMDFSLEIQAFLKQKGVIVPLDMHAMPVAFAFGEIERHELPPIGSSDPIKVIIETFNPFLVRATVPKEF